MGLTLTEKFQEKSAALLPKQDRAPISINSNAPIASLAAAGQQFTCVGDTNHENPEILNRVTAEMPSLAKAGVKKLMIEYTADKENRDFLKLLNHKPPRLTEEQVLAKADSFRSKYDEDPENPSGKAYAGLFAAAMKNGVQVVFAGDTRGRKESTEMDRLYYSAIAYKAQNEQLEQHSQNLYADTDYLKKQGLSSKEQKDLRNRITEHRNWLDKNLSDWERTHKAFNNARMGTDAEAERARRIVALADGEKTVLIFGSLHFQKQNDLNEAIDKEVRKDAFKRGIDPNQRDSKVIEIWDNKFAAFQSSRGIEDIQKEKAKPSDLKMYLDTMTVEIPEGSNARFQTTPSADTQSTYDLRQPQRGNQLTL